MKKKYQLVYIYYLESRSNQVVQPDITNIGTAVDEYERQIEDSKADIGWGSQIRSYVLDQSRVKDIRTNVEVTNPTAVLDGDLDIFIEASLKLANQTRGTG